MLTVVSQRGDTIIEVLLAITIFSMVSIGTLTIMNQGTNTSQRALEITQVRHQVDAQAEAIRAAQLAATTATTPESAAVAVWRSIALPANADDTVPHTGSDCPTDDPERSFIMDANKATKLGGAWFRDINTAGAPPYAQVQYSGGVAQAAYGMWIERDAEPAANTSDFRTAYSFAVNACWNGAGSDVPQRMRTVVRVYDPL